MTCQEYTDAIDAKDWDALVAEGSIVECPLCGAYEGNGDNLLAEAFPGLPIGVHGASVDCHCATLDVHYMPEDSPYAADCYTHCEG